jgi:hypothetical protein
VLCCRILLIVSTFLIIEVMGNVDGVLELDGIASHIKSGPNTWRIPFGFQLVPAGIMFLGLFTVPVSLLPFPPYP